MKDKKTIIFISPLPPPYMGPSVATEIILNSRFLDEFNLIHIDTADRRPLAMLARLDLTNIFLAFKHYYLLFTQLIKNQVDLVYIPVCQTLIGFLRDVPFIVISKLFRKKVVLHLRGGYFRGFYESSSKLVRYIVRKTLNKVERMIVLGSSLKSLFDGLIPEEKISVVPNGLNLTLNGRKSPREVQSPLKVLYLSNLIKTKGYQEVLHSVKKVIPHCNVVKFVFAGSWRDKRDRRDCEKYIEAESIGNFVEFLGPVVGKDKIRLLEESDIFVFPTYYDMEGHPWVIVEAMAAGLPVITTSQGCIRESVRDGENGFIIPKKNPDALARKIKYLIGHPDVREKMGSRSRRFYETNFTEKHFIRRMIEAMNSTLLC